MSSVNVKEVVGVTGLGGSQTALEPGKGGDDFLHHHGKVARACRSSFFAAHPLFKLRARRSYSSIHYLRITVLIVSLTLFI